MFEHVADRAGVIATDIIVLTRHRFYRDHRRDHVALDHRDLLRKGRFGKNVSASRAGMGKHASGYHLLAVGLGVEAADQIGANFRDRIRRCGVKSALLADRYLLLRDSPVYL